MAFVPHIGSIFLYCIDYQAKNRPFVVIAARSLCMWMEYPRVCARWNDVALALVGTAEDMLNVLVFGVGMSTGRAIRMLPTFYPLSQSNRMSTGTHVFNISYIDIYYQYMI